MYDNIIIPTIFFHSVVKKTSSKRNLQETSFSVRLFLPRSLSITFLIFPVYNPETISLAIPLFNNILVIKMVYLTIYQKPMNFAKQ